MKKNMLLAFLMVVSLVNTAFAAFEPPPQVPEPGTFVLLGLGAVGLIAYKNFKK